MRSFFMAAYDVFERNALHAWLMQRMGAFSVDRDGSDMHSLKQSIATLESGKYALSIFPEGVALAHLQGPRDSSSVRLG